MTIFAGHYGSGKTSLALNFALAAKRKAPQVILCDLDIVNPYFRTADSKAEMEAAGVTMISPVYANTNVDLPSVPPEAAAMFTNSDSAVVVDVGGDDAGAVALGQFSKRISGESCQMLLVINKYRYLTQTAGEALSVMYEVENASRLKFTGIVNNSNLGAETTAADVIDSIPYAENISKKAGLPIVMTAVRADLSEEVKKACQRIFAIRIFKKTAWAI